MARGSQEPWGPTWRALVVAAVLHALGLVGIHQAASHLDAATPPPTDVVGARVEVVEVELARTAAPPPESARMARVDAAPRVVDPTSRVSTRRLMVEPPEAEEPRPDVVGDEAPTAAPAAGDEGRAGPPAAEG